MVRRLSLVLLIALVLLVAWNWSLVRSLVRPALIEQGVLTPEPVLLEQNMVAYDALGIVAPVTVNAGTSPLLVSDWSAIRQALREGVSLAYQGDTFASAPLAFVTGHSSDTVRHPYDSIFAPLGQAARGDKFRIAVEDGSYEYRVVDTKQLEPADADGFAALAPSAGAAPRLVLVTCWPPLTTQLRFVVVGERL